MELKFTKMHGCGNDYIFIDCLGMAGKGQTPCSDTRQVSLPNFRQSHLSGPGHEKAAAMLLASPETFSRALSDRHKGVGGDGLVFITQSQIADAGMRMFNSDGSEGGMCGNAIRCVAKYLYDNGIVEKTQMQIETASGVRELVCITEGGPVTGVRVNMGRAELSPDKIPVRLRGENIISRPINFGGAEYGITCVSMGNPHAVIFYPDIVNLDLRNIGPVVENDPLFPDRANVEFVKVINNRLLDMRVWERGSGETQACGTGACAAAVAAALNGYCAKGADITVRLPGGDLLINYTDDAVYMTGNCVKTFEGTVEIHTDIM